MKDKIIYLVLGILIGAIITAGGFMVFSKNGGRPMQKDMPKEGMENRIRGERPDDGKEPVEAGTMENNI